MILNDKHILHALLTNVVHCYLFCIINLESHSWDVKTSFSSNLVITSYFWNIEYNTSLLNNNKITPLKSSASNSVTFTNICLVLISNR